MGKNLPFILVLMMLAGIAFCNFELRALNVSITLNPDGTAHVVEEAHLFINTSQSIELYKQSRTVNDLSSWTARTEISDLRTHLSRAYVEISNLQVRPGTVQNCNNVAETCYASLVLDYDVYPIRGKTAGLLDASMYKPRTTKYSLRNEVFTFNRSKTDDIILSKNMAIFVAVPDDATRITFSKVPDNFNDADILLFKFDSKTGNNYYYGQKRSFEWSGQTLSQFGMSYELEQSLEDEITQFFSQMQKKIFGSILSAEGLAYILAAITILASLLWLHSLDLK